MSEANYPERMHKTMMVPVGGFVLGIIKAALYFVDEKTRAKFAFTNNLGLWKRI